MRSSILARASCLFLSIKTEYGVAACCCLSEGGGALTWLLSPLSVDSDSSLVILSSPSVVGWTLPIRNPSTNIAGLGEVLSLSLTMGVVVLAVVSLTKLKVLIGLGLFLSFTFFFI